MKVKNISKVFRNQSGKIDVLQNISFDLEEGEILAIVGPSGCGKTTLLNILASFESPTNGKIILEESDNKLGYLFQTPALLPWKNILDNVLIGLKVQNNLNDATKKKAIHLLKRYGLSEFEKEYPSTLSGGMRQRVAFVRTMITEPTMLLLDEPFSSLDYEKKLKMELFTYEYIKEKKLSAILVTHDIDEAIALADRILVFSQRPARILSEQKITINNLNPVQRREHATFGSYFKKIWVKMDLETNN